MALVNIQEKWSNVNASNERMAGTTSRYAWVAARAYTVLYDAAPADGAFEAQAAAGLPSIGDSFSATYTPLKLIRRRAIPIGPMLFEVVCEYQGNTTILDDPYEKSWQDASSTEQIERDVNDVLIANVLGDPLTGITRDISDPVYVVTRNEASEPSTANLTYWNAINSDEFKGWPIGTARMLPIQSTRQIDGTTYYWKSTYRVQFRASGWAVAVRNEGKLCWDGTLNSDSTKHKVACKADDGVTPATRLLDADGRQLATGGTVVWLSFDIYPPVAFAGLGIS